MRTLDRIAAMPHIAEVVNEREWGHGYWAHSAPGWFFVDTECHTAREDTLRELIRCCRHVRPCTTHDCDRMGVVVRATHHWCQRCRTAFPLALGKYGCPNCNGSAHA